jgi:prophage maintenance system killer protein
LSVNLLGVSADEVRAINRGFGGTRQMNSTVEAVFQSASYVPSFWEKVAIVVRSIAGGHLFDNGNKRTAFEAVKLFRRRNNIVTGTPDSQLRETVRLVAVHLLEDVQEIAKSLKGF